MYTSKLERSKKVNTTSNPSAYCNDPIDTIKSIKTSSPAKQETTLEEKFIREVYPQFKGKTKLQLIEDIIELKRLNELLQDKAKNYENTINRLLN
jgi:hypothetical protein